MSAYEPLLWAALAILVAIGVLQARTLRTLQADLAETQKWADIWRQEAKAAQDSVWDLHDECEQLREQHRHLQQLYAERTQVALWAGMTRFLMN